MAPNGLRLTGRRGATGGCRTASRCSRWLWTRVASRTTRAIRGAVRGDAKRRPNDVYVDPHKNRIGQFLALLHAATIREPYAITVLVSMKGRQEGVARGAARRRDSHRISASLFFASLDSSDVGNSSSTRFKLLFDLTRSPVSAVANPNLYSAAGAFSLPGYSASSESNV